jgi:hypothetical protein
VKSVCAADGSPMNDRILDLLRREFGQPKPGRKPKEKADQAVA